MAQYSVHDAKTNLSKLIAAALDGDEVIIARGQVPVVRLSPLTPTGRRIFGDLKGKLVMDPGFNDPLPDEELKEWSLD